MDNQELRRLLEQLHGEIEHTESIDEKGQEQLRDLATDIGKLLARSDDAKAQTSLLERLEDSISYLEVTHPTLTQTMSRVLETLSNAGI
jgi:polyhydroxyalkanoate synthesis regulator phasin